MKRPSTHPAEQYRRSLTALHEALEQTVALTSMKDGYVLAVANDPAVADELERMAHEDFTSVRREFRWAAFPFLVAIVVDRTEFEAWAAAR